MNTTKKNHLSELMKKSWQLVKVYGFSMAEAMRQMWAIYKLKAAMHKGIAKFLYTKLDGTVRTAWGTLKEDLLPTTGNNANRKKNDSVFVYYDQEKAAFRCFKVANFLRII